MAGARTQSTGPQTPHVMIGAVERNAHVRVTSESELYFVRTPC
jgi:hypothetical protein